MSPRFEPRSTAPPTRCTLPEHVVRAAAEAVAGSSAEAAPDDSVTVATWNVNRIPLARRGQDYRDDRAACMSEILQQFDVTALSERFLPMPRLQGHAYVSEDSNTNRINWLMLRSQHHGLTMSSALPMRIGAEEHYEDCSPNRADCRVRKGFIISEVQTPRGPVIIVTTHLDAGRTERDRTVRASQLEHLTLALQPYAGRPLILMGDLNLTTSDPQDTLIYERFMQQHGLDTQIRQSGRGHDVLTTRGVDVLRATEYSNDALTDHPLLAARIMITRTGEADGTEGVIRVR